jgi:hypothetical protein
MNNPRANNNTIKLIIRIVTEGKPITVELLLMYSIRVGAKALKNITKINKPITPSTAKVRVSDIPISNHTPFLLY